MFAFIRQVFRGFSLATLLVLTLPVAIFVCIVGGFVFLPLPANLPTPRATLPSQGTQVYDASGNQIALIRRYDQNIPVAQTDIPSIMKEATVASEDKNFYKHKGIDVRGTLRAFWADLRNDKTVQGGSTITQQYVKLAYTNRERTVTRKIREAVLASQLDRQTDKEQILYKYLSAVYFGDGTYGVGAASQSYFRVPVNQLNASEAATLVGVIPAPSAWAPRENLDQAEARRKEVLGKMLAQKYVTQAQYDDAIAHPLWLESEGTPPGPVTMVYNEQAPQAQFPYYVDYVKRYLIAKYGSDAVYQGGLRVQTALDPNLQQQAEATVANTLKGTSAPLDMSLVSVEPQTGYVRALVGGRDFAKAQVNLALGGCPTRPPANVKVQVEPTCWHTPSVTGGGTGRQPGSSFKPFVLATAYSEGMSPSKYYSDPSVYSIPDCRGSSCTIHNSEGESRGPISIKEAMAYSLNTVYAPLIRDVGFTQTAETAKKLGLDDAWYSQTIHSTSGTYALGVIDVSPLEMASAYGVFADGGLRQVATPVVKAVDATGKVLEDNSDRQPTRALDKAVADNVTDALRGVVDHGTAAGHVNIGRPVAGKTGTTESFGDAWFVGYTPSLSTSVWMGYSDYVHTINYKGNRQVYGGTVPADTWTAYMKQALANVPVTDFSQPAPISSVNKDALTVAGPTTIPPIAPQVTRKPTPTPTGDYDQTSGGTQTVATPPTTAASTAP